MELNHGLHFKNLSSFISYIYYLTSSSANSEVDYDSKELLELHKGKSVLKVDKYLSCAIPSPELEFVLESQGILNYEAFLDPEFNWKHGICTHDDIISEIFSPNISGDHFNPYIRFKSCISSSSRSCSLLMDLAGLELKDIITRNNIHDNIFLDLVCTFPSVVDYFLMNPECRSRSVNRLSKTGSPIPIRNRDIKSVNFIDRMNKCRRIFFQRLNSFFGVHQDQWLGMSSSLHVWGSEIPVIPHAHIHNIVYFGSFDKKVSRDPDFYDSFNIFDLGLDKLEDFLDPVFVEVDITPRNSNKPFESYQSFGSNKKLNNTKTRIVTSDKKVIKRMVVIFPVSLIVI